jgi:hypothetical protein
LAEAICKIRRESVMTEKAKFKHDFTLLNKIDMRIWADSWISNIIRANNESLEYKTIFIGLGKTARLLRLRSNLKPLNESARREITKKYKKSKRRVIILDNEVFSS